MKIFKWILGLVLSFLTFCLITVFAALIHSNVQKLAEEKHWDMFLTQFWEPVTSRLTALTASPWFWFFFGLSLGIVLGMLASKLFPDIKRQIPPVIDEEESDSKEERERMHSFLKGLKPGVQSKNTAEVITAINDEMARLIPPKKKN